MLCGGGGVMHLLQLIGIGRCGSPHNATYIDHTPCPSSVPTRRRLPGGSPAAAPKPSAAAALAALAAAPSNESPCSSTQRSSLTCAPPPAGPPVSGSGPDSGTSPVVGEAADTCSTVSNREANAVRWKRQQREKER